MNYIIYIKRIFFITLSIAGVATSAYAGCPSPGNNLTVTSIFYNTEEINKVNIGVKDKNGSPWSNITLNISSQQGQLMLYALDEAYFSKQHIDISCADGYAISTVADHIYK